MEEIKKAAPRTGNGSDRQDEVKKKKKNRFGNQRQ